MIVPIFKATLCSLSRDRIDRLGGMESITLWDLSREFREGSGDVGICFEYAVHDGICRIAENIWPLASEVLERYCRIRGGAQSLLFGPEKDGVIPIAQSIVNALTDEAILHSGQPGNPLRLRRHIPNLIAAFRSAAARERLPRSIKGLWKADLFLGNAQRQVWVGTTVKINPAHLEAAQGLRIGVYPKANDGDMPRLDEKLNLIRLPLAYDSSFMELFYKSFNVTRAFMRADARIPRPVDLPDAEDRYCTGELESRRDYPVVDVLDAIMNMAQRDLLLESEECALVADASISEVTGLHVPAQLTPANLVSLAPLAATPLD